MKRILIVDDIEENRYLLRVLLEGNGYMVEQAVNGGDAVVRALAEPPDLVISDILMPVIDGYTLCRIWKSDERLKRAPFIFYTSTYTDPRDEHLAFDMGADAFIVKPEEPDVFLERIKATLAMVKEDGMSSPREPRVGNETILKNYSEALIRKLEQKMIELEGVNRKLEEEIAKKNIIEHDLRESEQLFRNIFHQHSAVKLIIDPSTGAVVDANRSAELFYGWSRAQLLEMKIYNINLLPPESVKTAMKSVINQQKTRFEFRHKRADGSVRDVEVFSSNIQLEGKVFLHSIIHDITDRKKAEGSLRESERLFLLITENMADTVWLMDLDFKYVYVSPSLLKNRGLTLEEFKNTPFERLLTPESCSLAMSIMADELSPDRLARKYLTISRTVALESYRKDGSTFWSEVTMKLLRDQAGAPIGYLGVGRDITDRKTAEDELSKLNRELEKRVADRTADLEKANRELESFSYTVSHDLRAPLRHINGFLEMLNRETEELLNDRARHFMKVINDSALRMGCLIDDLLMFSRMGRGEFQRTDVDMSSVVNEAAHLLESDIRNRSIRLRVNKLPNACGDRSLLLVVVTNLLSNAVKFTARTEKPEITITGNIENDESVYCVKDNGAGFDMRYVNKLFGVFQRLHGENDFPGTGIGLATVRRVIERHGGRVWAEGEDNAGARFYFSIPYVREIA